MAARCFWTNWDTLSMAAQERLLRAVEYGEVTRIGSSRPLNVDVRIVAATNEHLPDAVAAGRFRADLLDRLCFEVITLPPLRGRDGDVEVLGRAFRPAHGHRVPLAGLAGILARGDAAADQLSLARQCPRTPGTSSSAPSIAGTIPSSRSTRFSSIPFASPWKPEPMPTHKAAKAAPAAVATSHAEAANDEAPATNGCHARK